MLNRVSRDVSKAGADVVLAPADGRSVEVGGIILNPSLDTTTVVSEESAGVRAGVELPSISKVDVIIFADNNMLCVEVTSTVV